MRLSPLAVFAPLLLVACAPRGEQISFDDPSSAAASDAISEGAASATVIEVSSEAPAPPAEPPSKVAHDVPFASQAPLGNWGMPYQEACEEASLILADRFFEGRGITPQEMDAEIIAAVAWQESVGMSADITAAEMVRTAEEHLGLDAEVLYDADVTVERIESELAAGNLVVLPLAGQDIGNPYFSGDGPPYHVLVVTGYDSRSFITNDVGTKRGEGYKYRKNVLFDAIHDWPGDKDRIRSGRRAMVVVRP